jgi:tetratricopeptide (TPR) repeat protein
MRIELLAGTVLVDAGRLDRAAPIQSRLSGSLVSDERDAVPVFQDALHMRESWLGQYGLALAYFDAGAFAEAYTELQTCFARRGEAADYWLPSAHLITPVLYYLARAEEALGNPEAGATYARFLALEPDAQGDPLALDAKKRAAR